MCLLWRVGHVTSRLAARSLNEWNRVTNGTEKTASLWPASYPIHNCCRCITYVEVVRPFYARVSVPGANHTSPKWPLLCRVGRKTLTESHSLAATTRRNEEATPTSRHGRSSSLVVSSVEFLSPTRETNRRLPRLAVYIPSSSEQKCRGRHKFLQFRTNHYVTRTHQQMR